MFKKKVMSGVWPIMMSSDGRMTVAEGEWLRRQWQCQRGKRDRECERLHRQALAKQLMTVASREKGAAQLTLLPLAQPAAVVVDASCCTQSVLVSHLVSVRAVMNHESWSNIIGVKDNRRLRIHFNGFHPRARRTNARKSNARARLTEKSNPRKSMARLGH